MSKRILLIDSDESFVQDLSAAVAQGGFVALAATDSEQGMTLAREEAPDLIVVCVEAQPTNGYMLCTRLKKDDQLKSIPVILTSANATADSFEKHKKLKTRAEDYLIKPFDPRAMLEKASQLLGVPLGGEGEEEIVSMEDESLGLGDLVGDDEPISLSEEDVREAHAAEEPMVVEEIEEIEEVEDVVVDDALSEAPAGDDELSKFDEAFDALKPSDPAPVEKPKLRLAPEPKTEAELEITDAGDSSDEEDVLAGFSPSDAPAASGSLQARSGQRAANPLQRTDAARKAPPGAEQPKPEKQDKELLRLKKELEDKEKQLLELQEHQTTLEEQVQQLRDEAAKRDAAAKALQQRADALAAAAKKFERELTQAREELKSGKGRGGDPDQLRAEMEEMREQMNALAGEKELLSEHREELRKQLEEAQATASQNEERAVKAYQKMKGDEKLREKTRKALEIALQLLEDDTKAESEREKKSA